MTAATAASLPVRLLEHLNSWTGGWPPTSPPTVAGNPRNAAPGWDGARHALTGVVDPGGHAVVGVPPERAGAAQAARDHTDGDLGTLLATLPSVLGLPDHRVYRGVLRWTTAPAELPAAGDWVDARDPVVPAWLRPFGHQVLIARDGDGRYLAGVGIKRHDPAGHELSVGTEPAARGRGLARRLVAQAALAVLANGAVPTYLHDPANIASARVADASGFPDLGWQALGLFAPQPHPDAYPRTS